MSEVNENGDVLATFTDVNVDQPQHLFTDSKGHLLVADHRNHRILLLNSELELELEFVFVDRNSQVKALWWPERLSYNESTSQLCVLHKNDEFGWFKVISNFRLQ